MKYIHTYIFIHIALPWWLSGKKSACKKIKNLLAMNETHIRSLGQEDSREGNGNPSQYSCLGNPMDRGAWQATVHGVGKSWIQLRD